ncbi:MAG: inorganic phosphate transporter [Elusimicrobia bacterium]|nr:inorganic phosphate transporter [Candidatus Obscuribacterium magneticum]
MTDLTLTALLSFSVATLGLMFAFSNGFRDSSTIVATIVSTRALSPAVAFITCSLAQLSGALFFGSAVASTIGKGIFGAVLGNSRVDMLLTLTAALSAAFVWGVVSWWRAWPTSNNQALFAGLVGASYATWGLEYLNRAVLFKVVLVLVTSPLLGFLASMLLTRLARFAGEWLTPRVKPFFRFLHVGSCVMLSFGHGSNDGQIIMGVLILAFGWTHVWAAENAVAIPPHVRALVAVALGGGVLLGGKRILKRLGMSFYRIRPHQGVCADLASAGTIMLCTLAGFPASTTQVITGSIVGAGAAKTVSAVRWNVAREIALSWIITLPAVAVLSAVLSRVLHKLAEVL